MTIMMAANIEREINVSDRNSDSEYFLFKSYLDEVEDRAEELRRKAISLSQERDSLLTILSQLKHDRLRFSITEDESYEISAAIEHLQQRCKNVEITIKTSRSPEQETSYLLVNSLVSELEHKCVLGNTNRAFVHQAKGYLNACISDGISQGPVDYKFQGIILGCKLEDQKLVRHRLECLVKKNCHGDFIDQTFESQQQYTSGPTDEEQHSCNADAQNIDSCTVDDAASSDSHIEAVSSGSHVDAVRSGSHVDAVSSGSH